MQVKLLYDLAIERIKFCEDNIKSGKIPYDIKATYLWEHTLLDWQEIKKLIEAYTYGYPYSSYRTTLHELDIRANYQIGQLMEIERKIEAFTSFNGNDEKLKEVHQTAMDRIKLYNDALIELFMLIELHKKSLSQ